MNNIDTLMIANGYEYEIMPHSGRPAYRKEFKNGFIIFYPWYKVIKGSPFVGLLIRKVKGEWLETIHENTFNIIAVDSEQVKYTEYLFSVA